MVISRVRFSTVLRQGFALPTVLIASIVMLMVLTVSVSSVVAVRNAIQTQYYEQLAKTAGEAGVAYAKACLAKNGNVPLWTNAKPLKPNTDCAGNSLLDNSVRVLVIAGGGGGAATGSGGGGGGFIENQNVTVGVSNYSVVVGAGGAGGTYAGTRVGGQGGSSSFNGVVATGGGGGDFHGSVTSGNAGGSGGGGAIKTGGAANLGGLGDGAQGFNGGNGLVDSGWVGNSGGGGGAGGVGINGGNTAGSGAGGPGKVSDITGSDIYYAGGGGGGEVNGSYAGGGGSGGGGTARVSNSGISGLVNTGGGGGGGSYDGTYYSGGNGGSGVVVIRYVNNGTISATGGDSVYVDGLYKVHKFTTTGTSSFNVTALSNPTCPSDPRCSVMVDGNVRSSFSVGLPTLDANGRAVAIPNTGYTELLRASNGAVWRTYNQPSVQSAVVPGLCSGSTTSSLGWSYAVETASQAPIPDSPAAKYISVADGSLVAGKTFYRSDFVVNNSGNYVLSAMTLNNNVQADFYIDGAQKATVAGQSLSNTSITLDAGCHTVLTELTNRTLLIAPASFIASIKTDTGDSTPIVASNSDWRTSTGSIVSYSQPDFDANPWLWSPVINYGSGTAKAYSSAWMTTQADAFTQQITAPGCTGSCPGTSTTYFTDSKDIYVSSDTPIIISGICDDVCNVYVDGVQVLTMYLSSVAQATYTLPSGRHHVGFSLNNGGGATWAALSIARKSDNAVLTRTDLTWRVSNQWFTNPGPTDLQSYQVSFKPNPSSLPNLTTIDALIVAGGGGGGGNCTGCGGAGGGGGGGVVYQQDITATVTGYTVTVGGGGSGGLGSTGSSSTNGANGANSQFGSYIAYGGGGGANQYDSTGENGGSGGGGSGGGSPPNGPGGNGTSGQGYHGGSGGPQSLNYNGGGGGGATGTGVGAATTPAGDGGSGLVNYFDGTLKVFGSGGGAGSYTSYTGGLGEPGVAGNGVNNATNGGNGYSATANTGGGGGGANGNNKGGNGGAGGSGIVLVKFVKNSLTVGSITGSLVYTSSDATIDGVTYTVYKFTSGSGTFNVTAVN